MTPTRRKAAVTAACAVATIAVFAACAAAPAPPVPTSAPAPASAAEKSIDPHAGNRFTPSKTAPPAPTVPAGQHHPPGSR